MGHPGIEIERVLLFDGAALRLRWLWFCSVLPSPSAALLLSVYLSVYLSMHLSVSLSICLSIYISIYMSVYLFSYQSVYLFVCLSVYLLIFLLVCVDVCLSVYLSICLYVRLSVSVCRPERLGRGSAWSPVRHGVGLLIYCSGTPWHRKRAGPPV